MRAESGFSYCPYCSAPVSLDIRERKTGNAIVVACAACKYAMAVPMVAKSYDARKRLFEEDATVWKVMGKAFADSTETV